MSTTQYWSNTQKLQFSNTTLGTHTCVHNPTVYNMVPLTKAQASVPAQPGPNVLSGGVEFASGSIPMEWPEMDYSEYVALGAYHLQPSTMIDMYDNGYLGWLILASHEPPAGVSTKVAKVKATFVVSKPANGLVSTINVLAPGTLSLSAASGGSIASGVTLYYALTFWSKWGESLSSPVESITTSAANQMITASWTAPTSAFYRKARLYVATSSIAGGSVANVKADVYTAFTQSFVDYCGTNGVTATATIPTESQSYIGDFRGGIWQNAT